MSPEALGAAAVFGAVQPALIDTLQESVGGRELASMGFSGDVGVAADLNASPVVPVLVDGAFCLAG